MIFIIVLNPYWKRKRNIKRRIVARHRCHNSATAFATAVGTSWRPKQPQQWHAADKRETSRRQTSSNFHWLVVWTPLKNVSQLGWLFPIYGTISQSCSSHHPFRSIDEEPKDENPPSSPSWPGIHATNTWGKSPLRWCNGGRLWKNSSEITDVYNLRWHRLVYNLYNYITITMFVPISLGNTPPKSWQCTQEDQVVQ